MINKFILIILVFFSSFFIIKIANAAYFSADLKDAIKIECKEAVKQKKYPNKKTCEKEIKLALEHQGVVNINKIQDEEERLHIETLCVFEIKLGALRYNECIYQEVNKSLGIEIVEPPVLEKNQLETGEDKDDESPPIQVPMPENVINDVYDKVKGATFFVALYAYKNNEWWGHSSGSAVHLGDGLLVTNCHVVSYCWPHESAKNCDTKTAIDIINIEENVMDANNEKWFRDLVIIKEHTQSDRCIIETSSKTFIYPDVKLKYFKDLKIGDTVYAVGNPKGFTGMPKEGKITNLYKHIPPGLHKLTGGELEGLDLQYIESDVPVNKGNSGGGLYSSKGELIGVTSLCDPLGGEQECFKTSEGEEQCVTYCNVISPQNWSIPIGTYIDLL